MSARSEASAKSAEVRRRRLRKLGIRLGISVGIPTLLAIVYYGLIAAPQYQSVTMVAVQSAAVKAPNEALDSVLPKTTSNQDGDIVREYIMSREMIQRLVDDYDFVGHYSSQGDFFTNLDAGAPLEDVYAYYVDHIEVTYRRSSGTMSLHIRAFSPQAAQSLAEGILTESQTILARLAADRPSQPSTKLVSISRPSLPDAPSYPRRLWGIATVFFVALALTIVIGLFAGAVREHAKL